MILHKRPFVTSVATGLLLFGLTACDTRDKNGYEGNAPTPPNQGAQAGPGAQQPGGQSGGMGVESGQKSDGAATGSSVGGGGTKR